MSCPDHYNVLVLECLCVWLGILWNKHHTPCNQSMLTAYPCLRGKQDCGGWHGIWMSNLTYSAHLFCEALGEGGQHSPKAFNAWWEDERSLQQRIGWRIFQSVPQLNYCHKLIYVSKMLWPANQWNQTVLAAQVPKVFSPDLSGRARAVLTSIAAQIWFDAGWCRPWQIIQGYSIDNCFLGASLGNHRCWIRSRLHVIGFYFQSIFRLTSWWWVKISTHSHLLSL